ncbi:unnamed protein product [Boreogadus saida]
MIFIQRDLLEGVRQLRRVQEQLLLVERERLLLAKAKFELNKGITWGGDISLWFMVVWNIRKRQPAVDVAKTAGVILCLCSTGAVAAAQTAAWQHLIQRDLWLQQTPGIPEPMRRQLLELAFRCK